MSSSFPIFSAFFCHLTIFLRFSGLQGHDVSSVLRQDEGPQERQAYSSYSSLPGGSGYSSLGNGYASPTEPYPAYPSRFPYPTYAQSVSFDESLLQHYPVSTVPTTSCKSTTFRTNLGCYCGLVGQRCFAEHSICYGDQNGDGNCGCVSGYVAYKYQCITTAAYNNITSNGTATFVISGPTIIASCFLAINDVLGQVPGIGGTGTTYSLTLVSSAPLGDLNKYVDVDPSTGQLLYKIIAPGSLTNQIYRLVASNGTLSTNKTFTVAYNCTAPSCAFNFGNSLIVDCLRYTIGDTVVQLLVTGSLSPTVFSMSLINSSSRNGNTFFRIDSSTGQVIVQKIPNGGIFVENYSVAATNAAGVSCLPQTLTITTTATCV